MRTAAGILLACALLALAACGGDDGEPTDSAAVESGPCDPIEEVEVMTFGQHSSERFTVGDYVSNPPAGGDHNPTPLEAGTFYRRPPPLGQSVHLLEHGAVIGWTNGLDEADEKAVQQAFNEVFQDGYYQLAVVENPDLDVPFALSAWGAVQKCGEVDTSVIRPFVEDWYASPKSAESGVACAGDARRLPQC
jgi:Protein of unknown function (DUF3105)